MNTEDVSIQCVIKEKTTICLDEIVVGDLLQVRYVDLHDHNNKNESFMLNSISTRIFTGVEIVVLVLSVLKRGNLVTIDTTKGKFSGVNQQEAYRLSRRNAA